jgi:hypothetical protein
VTPDDLRIQFEALPPAEQAQFLRGLECSTAVSRAGFAVVPADLIPSMMRHVGRLMQMFAALLPPLVKHSNRTWKISRKPSDQTQEAIRLREGGMKLLQISERLKIPLDNLKNRFSYHRTHRRPPK